MLKYAQAANCADEVVRGVDEVLAQGKTPFQEYLFIRSKMHGTCISLDGDIQSCASDEAIYHEALVHPAMLMHPAPKQVLIMGGGEGATAREVLRHTTVEKVVMVDIDRDFVELCRRHIPEWSEGVWDAPRLELHYQDINVYLQDCEHKFDVVIGDLVDVHDWDSPVAALYGSEFYGRLKACLSDDAVVATQGGPLVGNDLDGHNHIRQTFGTAFKEVASYGMVVPSFYHLWGYVIASDAPLETDLKVVLQRFEQAASARSLELGATGVDSLSGAFALPRQIAHGLR